MRKKLLFLAAVILPWAFSACTTCYNERFCQELVGLGSAQVVSILGAPTHIYEQGSTKVMEWAYNCTYMTNYVVPGRADSWVDSRGGVHSTFVPPYEHVSAIPQVAVLRLTFEKDHVVAYTSQFNGSGMCNHFVPANYIQRYKMEDNARRRE